MRMSSETPSNLSPWTTSSRRTIGRFVQDSSAISMWPVTWFAARPCSSQNSSWLPATYLTTVPCFTMPKMRRITSV